MREATRITSARLFRQTPNSERPRDWLTPNSEIVAQASLAFANSRPRAHLRSLKLFLSIDARERRFLLV